MICLDTNFLILGLVPGSQEMRDLIAWSQAGETLITPAIVWYEFLCGPVTQAQIDTMRRFLLDIIDFSEAQATQAAYLFNVSGRNRRTRVDAMIAGTAVALGAQLATNNRADFEVFRPHGLVLAR